MTRGQILDSMATQETVAPYALTTLQRVKDRLEITINDFDPILTRIINGATDFIERECGKSGLERYPNDGHFVQKKYTNEVYSVRGTKQERLVLRNAPVTYLIVTGNLTSGSAVVSNCSPVTGIAAGMPLYNIQGLFPQGTTVVSVSGTSVTMSQPASVTQNGAVFEISGLISFQWRAGTPSNPNWTAFIPDQFELEQQGYSGIVRVYGVMPRIYSNMLRATYIAGYPINWQNAGDGATHQLPADLSNLCENLTVRIYKQRLLAGKASENIQGATVAWRNSLDALDLNTIDNYRRVGTMF
jgi:Phage gp6-like head-tail connector protein